MAAESPSPSDRISAAVQKLIPVAQKLNSASEGLSKPVADLEASLKRLNLGVASWTNLSKSEDSHGFHTEWDLGYARHEGRWGIVLRHTKGSRSYPDQEDEDTWFFNDAPRFMKSKAVDMLPELIEGLVAVSDKTAEKLLRKTPVAQELAGAVAVLLDPKKK